MAGNNRQELLQAFSSFFYIHIIKSILGQIDLSRERRDYYSGRLILQRKAEAFKIGVASSDFGVFFLECWDVGSAYNLVVGEHIVTIAMGLSVDNLYFKEILWFSINLIKRLLLEPRASSVL